MGTLVEIVKETVFEYAAGGFNLKTFKMADEAQQAYAVNIVDTPIRRLPADVVVMARVVGDQVIIDEDTTDRPLYEALMRKGIPREKIILAYAGENVTP